MKQKIITRAVIKEDGKVLLVRRSKSTGNSDLHGLYELPGGTMEAGEQPAESIRRELQEELSIEAETVQLSDALSIVESGETVHYLTLVYMVALAPHDRKVQLSNEHDKYVWKKLKDIQYDEITYSTQVILNLTPFPNSTDETAGWSNDHDDKNASLQKLIIYTDGGSRGNPGPSAAGYVVMNEREEVIYEGGTYLGITTNNQAEYQAICSALLKAKELGARYVDLRMDSLLAVNQLGGIYQIRNKELWPVHARIKELTSGFDKVTFKHVKREFNQLADGMVNRILDQQAQLER